MQLLVVTEERLVAVGLCTPLIRMLADLRADADHKVLESDAEHTSHSRAVATLCDEFALSLERLAELSNLPTQ